MNLFLIIQARMTSTRLPGKVMLPMCDKTVLEVMLERLRSFHDNIIIATTDDGTEMPIINVCKDLEVRFFRGSTDNVLERYYLSAKHFGATRDDIIVRCTSDCPLIQPQIVSDAIAYFKDHQYDYVSAGTHSGYPRGMDTEVFRFSMLEEAYNNATTAYEREHVTPYIHTTKVRHLKVSSFTNSSDNSKYRLTLDEPDDYKAIAMIYQGLNCRTDFSYNELITFLEASPHIYEINKHVEQKKQ